MNKPFQPLFGGKPDKSDGMDKAVKEMQKRAETAARAKAKKAKKSKPRPAPKVVVPQVTQQKRVLSGINLAGIAGLINNKKLFVVVLIVVILLIIGLLIYKQQQQKKKILSLSEKLKRLKHAK